MRTIIQVLALLKNLIYNKYFFSCRDSGKLCDEDKRRLFLIYVSLYLALCLVLAMGGVAFYQGKSLLGLVDMLIAMLIAMIIINQHFRCKLSFTVNMVTFLAGLFFFWLLIYGGVERTAFVWYYTFPLFAGFMLGLKRGTIYSIILGFGAIVYFISDSWFPFLAQYPVSFKLRFIPSYFVLIFFSYLAENLRAKASDELRKANENLEQRVRERTAELVSKNKELALASATDSLTGIKNRMKLDETLEYELNMANRYNNDLSMILIDLDFFKEVNDVYGHLAGDDVLRRFAKVISEHVRDTDTVGRWGGEEFLIICPSTNREKAMMIAEKLREVIASEKFPIIGSITASFGVTTHINGDNLNTIVKRADNALYLAKNKRNNCCFS